MDRFLCVSEIMSVSLVTARPDTTLAAAAAGMRARGVGSVLVCEGPQLLGILTERDFVNAVAERRDVAGTPASEAMSAPIIAAEPEWDIVYAARVMAERGIRHLPVVRDGTPLGMVSIRDVVRWGLAALEWDSTGDDARDAFAALRAGARLSVEGGAR